MLYHTEFEFLWFLRCWARHVSLCSIYFICKKSSHRFLLIFFLSYWGYSSHWNYEIKQWGSPCSFKRKGAFISLSSLVWGNLSRFVRARAHVRALMTRKSSAVRMRNAILIRNHFNKRTLLHYSLSINNWYHPTSGLMQILHFDWLRYEGTISNSHRVAKLAPSSVTLSFVLFPNQYFFNLHLLTLLLPFLSDKLGDTKTIRPFTLKGHGSIAHSASPHGLLTRSPWGRRV